MKKTLALAASLFAATLSPSFAADKYVLDASHSQVIFNYDHLGFSTTTGMFSGFEGSIMLDEANPAASSVNVAIKTDSILTGWKGRDDHFKAADFFEAAKHPLVTFKSTNVEVTGDNTAKISGDLTMNGVTKSVVLDAKLNKKANHPMAKKPAVGFDATTSIIRSEFDMGMAAPYVSDEVKLFISVEALKAE